MSEPEQLRALADELRGRIIGLLRERAWSTQQLARELEIPKGTIGHHLKVLERAGLIVRSRSGQWRPCRLQPAPLDDAAEWLEEYRRLWDGRLDRLADHVRDLQKGPPDA